MPRHSIHNRLALRERGAGMKLDFSQCRTPEDVERVMKAANKHIATHRRVLTGLAHLDLGKPQHGCDCCFCAPREKGEPNG